MTCFRRSRPPHYRSGDLNYTESMAAAEYSAWDAWSSRNKKTAQFRDREGRRNGNDKVPMQLLRILIVEDDASVMVAIERLVRALGFDASVAPSAEAVLEATRLDGFASMIVDIHLPGSTGVDMVKMLRSRGINIPTVFMSASENWSYRKDIEALGAGFLLKPFADDMLIAAIQEALAGRVGSG